MSGTSRDGMDAALLLTDGKRRILCKQSLTLPYDEDFRLALARLCAEPSKQKRKQKREQKKQQKGQEGGECSGLSARLAELGAEAVERLTQKKVEHSEEKERVSPSSSSSASSLAVIGFHGHTVFHAPERGKTLQIGDGELLARRSNALVVCNFRQKDMEHGGQGAPLAPLYHRAVARVIRDGNKHLREQPLLFVNIGGVANVTWIGVEEAAQSNKGGGAQREVDEGGESMLAFDTGPGNALLDDWVSTHTQQRFDKNGEIASRGSVCEQTLRTLLASPFFAQPPPKSLDRDTFAPALATLRAAGLSLEDGAATLTAFLIEGLCLAERFFPVPPHLWLLCGGGRKNRTFVHGLRQRLSRQKDRDGERPKICPIKICPVEDWGFDGDALEAQAFAYLAVRRLRGLPTAYPALTGASRATCGGDIHHPQHSPEESSENSDSAISSAISSRRSPTTSAS